MDSRNSGMGANPHPLSPGNSPHTLVSLKTRPVRRPPTLADRAIPIYASHPRKQGQETRSLKDQAQGNIPGRSAEPHLMIRHRRRWMLCGSLFPLCCDTVVLALARSHRDLLSGFAGRIGKRGCAGRNSGNGLPAPKHLPFLLPRHPVICTKGCR